MPDFHQFIDTIGLPLVRLIETIIVLLNNYVTPGNPVLAVILFTILFRIAVIPLMTKSIRSQQAMQIFQPKLKELEQKYGGRTSPKFQEESMKLYAEYGFNPFGSCLPLLLQMPFLFGLYSALLDVTVYHTQLNNLFFGVHTTPYAFKNSWPLFWLTDLGHYDPYYILPILAGVTQFILARVTMPEREPGVKDDAQTMTMNITQQLLPIMVVVFGWNFAAGPVIYWITGNIFLTFQTYFLNGFGSLRNWFPFLPAKKRKAFIPSNKPVKKSRMLNYMSSLMEAQNELRKRQEELNNHTIEGTLKEISTPKDQEPSEKEESTAITDTKT